ncbi:hypothetical protein [Aliikangiella sp. G2MR2-5]|uniref:hypothetical protein n=1 Tax=Aliikangiella sp. G2MR2-5 TaxID=2788943 RepID=UPI0018A908A8|nr:hypothetical protein [Aliikangiella sp. G2MR2-5]
MKTVNITPNISPFFKMSLFAWSITCVVGLFKEELAIFYIYSIALTALTIIYYLGWKVGLLRLAFKNTGIEYRFLTKRIFISKMDIFSLTYAKSGFGQTPIFILDNSGNEVGFSSINLKNSEWQKIKKCYGETVLYKEQLDSSQKL